MLFLLKPGNNGFKPYLDFKTRPRNHGMAFSYTMAENEKSHVWSYSITTYLRRKPNNEYICSDNK